MLALLTIGPEQTDWFADLLAGDDGVNEPLPDDRELDVLLEGAAQFQAGRGGGYFLLAIPAG